MTPNQDLIDKFYGQVSESIKSLFDLSARIDERVKNLVETTDQTKSAEHKLREEVNSFAHRLAVVELKLDKEISHLNQWKMQSRELIATADKRIAVLECDDNDIDMKQLEDRLRQVELKYEAVHIFKENSERRTWLWTDLAFKLIWTVVAAYLLWKLGLQPPVNP